MSQEFLTYLYLLTPLHTGASADEGNLIGIAREVHTEFPYLPSSSLRGKIRSEIERTHPGDRGKFFGQKIKEGQQSTEGEVWFADATLLLFPVASYSHQFLWITCPLWLSRWNRWLANPQLETVIQNWRTVLKKTDKVAISPLQGKVYLQGGIIQKKELEIIEANDPCWDAFKPLPGGNGILNLEEKLMVLSDDDCSSLVEMGLQREVRIALEEGKKTAKDGSYRSELALPSETVLFFPWGFKNEKNVDSQDVSSQAIKDKDKNNEKIREAIKKLLGAPRSGSLRDRLQFGGLEGLGRGWTESKTQAVDS